MLKIVTNSAETTDAPIERLPDLISHDDIVVWIDVSAPERSELESIAQILGLDPESVEDCLTGEQRPRMDDYDDYAFLLTYGMLGPVDRYEHDPRKLAIYCGRRFIVTVHREPIRAIEMVHRRLDRHQSGLLRGGPGNTLFMILDQIVDNYVVFMDYCESEVDRLEDRSLQDDCDRSILTDTAGLRSALAEIRHLALAVDQAIAAILADDFPFMNDDVEFDFLHVREHLKAVAEFADRLRDRLNGVRDNLAFVIADRTNEIMRVLTVFASIMLPLSLIAGIYGMNIPLWPHEKMPHAFAMVISGMFVLGAALWLFFRRKRWL
ncbi:MAG TPA: magnesium transporter CorA family protein [Phycisphaerae bacterium]|nr:magnesium transporter CorA family protein [Phycisphaerae bacterium]HRW55412.1 magnesium transporter CorA family protein [Phycisphaerae bacterium]